MTPFCHGIAALDHFSSVWLVDFEFHAPPGERPTPLCLVAREARTGRTLRLWQDELRSLDAAPFPVSDETLFVAYYASAELGCFVALGWPMPVRILDLYVEFRCRTSGLTLPSGRGLLGALMYHGIDGLEAVEKKQMRDLAIRGGPYTGAERAALVKYCESDVVALAKLLPAMLPQIDLPRALLRGRYMAAVSRMEWTGVPIDVDALAELREKWPTIKDRLIERIDAGYALADGWGIYAGQTFKIERFARWLAENDIPWPHLPSGALSLDDDTFRAMAKTYPAVAPLRELRHALAELRLEAIAVGSDGRNRCLLSPFQSRTGRNQPSNVKYIFGPSVWLRGLIRPQPGRAIAYIDYEQQEFGIAAALSCDAAMKAAYASGDPYLEFAKQAGAVPKDATRESHKNEREQFKVCALAVQYGMGDRSLALALNVGEAQARDLLRLHRETYQTFWQWSSAAVDHAMLLGYLYTVFGWRVHVDYDANPRSLANFPMQANGAEMLRLACCLATERGVPVCAPVHDAILIEAADAEIDDAVAVSQAAMKEASELVLGGFSLRTEAKIVRCPERYADPRGQNMWSEVWTLIRDRTTSEG